MYREREREMRNRHVLLEKAKSPKSPAAANPTKQAEKKGGERSARKRKRSDWDSNSRNAETKTPLFSFLLFLYILYVYM
jgi:hypothetical protein